MRRYFTWDLWCTGCILFMHPAVTPPANAIIALKTRNYSSGCDARISLVVTDGMSDGGEKWEKTLISVFHETFMALWFDEMSQRRSHCWSPAAEACTSELIKTHLEVVSPTPRSDPSAPSTGPPRKLLFTAAIERFRGDGSLVWSVKQGRVLWKGTKVRRDRDVTVPLGSVSLYGVIKSGQIL